MKLKLAALFIAISFSTTGISAINKGTEFTESGEFILSVWDDASSTSYTLDLGPLDTRNFFGERTVAGYDLNSDSNWNSFVSGVDDISELKWDVVASDRDEVDWTNPAPSINGIWTTARYGTDSAVKNVSFSAYNTLQSAVEQYTNILDGLNTDYATNNSYLLSGASYAGDTATWGSWKGNVTFAEAAYGETVNFWQLTTVKGAHPRPGMYTPTASHEKMVGFWTLDDGRLMYSAPIPLPAAAWLFLSSLIGIIGAGRRRKTK